MKAQVRQNSSIGKGVGHEVLSRGMSYWRLIASREFSFVKTLGSSQCSSECHTSKGIWVKEIIDFVDFKKGHKGGNREV